MSSPRFMNNSSAIIQTLWKFSFTAIQILMKWPPNLAMLPCHAQSVVAIYSSTTELPQDEISIKPECTNLTNPIMPLSLILNIARLRFDRDNKI